MVNVEKNPMADEASETPIEKLRSLHANMLQWKDRLEQREDKIVELENNLSKKEQILSTLENNLLIIEDRQEKFEQLISLYEREAGISPESPNYRDISQRPEMLEKAKYLSRKLEEYDETIAQSADNTKNLKDMILLMSSLHYKFSRLKNKALQNGLLDQCQYGYDDDGQEDEYYPDEEEEDYWKSSFVTVNK
ncbi:hypothetical protein TRFO_04222 [Tritrichomonas foetus]|uniref:Uncharacterized protein n=1 Tax=Tritrichomonas foetus TaxID=1144522 RepID=A0A1J4KIC8_9EUKA|nr:hypothetical protein TRFO_04222 [Tritrichomonas foetus]|eukprot:OHT10696.1 hypothetical protein TRFO_04222 [Tritrichomonas foetus]